VKNNHCRHGSRLHQPKDTLLPFYFWLIRLSIDTNHRSHTNTDSERKRWKLEGTARLRLQVGNPALLGILGTTEMMPRKSQLTCWGGNNLGPMSRWWPRVMVLSFGVAETFPLHHLYHHHRWFFIRAMCQNAK